jgi:hypothetical protein
MSVSNNLLANEGWLSTATLAMLGCSFRRQLRPFAGNRVQSIKFRIVLAGITSARTTSYCKLNRLRMTLPVKRVTDFWFGISAEPRLVRRGLKCSGSNDALLVAFGLANDEVDRIHAGNMREIDHQIVQMRIRDRMVKIPLDELLASPICCFYIVLRVPFTALPKLHDILHARL